MDVNLIVATGQNGEIGKKGDLIWHIREDLKRFKALTMSHPVIMGRKTWESLPKRPLPGRRNIVLTRNPGFKEEGAETVTSVEEALKITDGESPFVIGGAEIYNQLLPYATRIYLTEVLESEPDADAYLNLNRQKTEWTKEEESEIFKTDSGVPYRFSVFCKDTKSSEF